MSVDIIHLHVVFTKATRSFLLSLKDTSLAETPPAGEGEQEWQKELVNGSQNVVLKGLKGGLSYRVRLVAKGHHDQPLHHSEELLVTVPGEAVPGRSPRP